MRSRSEPAAVAEAVVIHQRGRGVALLLAGVVLAGGAFASETWSSDLVLGEVTLVLAVILLVRGVTALWSTLRVDPDGIVVRAPAVRRSAWWSEVRSIGVKRRRWLRPKLRVRLRSDEPIVAAVTLRDGDLRRLAEGLERYAPPGVDVRLR